jgi:hypothetical protein
MDLPQAIALPYTFAEGIVLDDLPEWVKAESTLRAFGATLSQHLKESTRYCIKADYEADALGSPVEGVRIGPPQSVQEAAFQSIKDVNLALWLAKPTSLGVMALLHGQQFDGEWHVRQSMRIDPLLALPEHEDAQLQEVDFDTARRVFAALRALDRSGTVRTASSATMRAFSEASWVLRFMIFWIVVESLFGPTDGREVTFRISQRLALFLGENREEALSFFKTAKANYGWRCKAVHGLRLGRLSAEKSLVLMNELENIVRLSLRRILGDPAVQGQFESDNRERYLDGLAFGGS